MKKVLYGFIESIPLTIFLIYIHLKKMETTQDWLVPYAIGAAGGLFVIACLQMNKIILNRIFLGITLYFCSGFLGVVFKYTWLNQTYGQLGALALLYWIFVVGFIFSVASRFGFLGRKSSTHLSLFHFLSIDTGSAILLLVCVLSIGIAVYFNSQGFLGEWLPFIILFSARSLLLKIIN